MEQLCAGLSHQLATITYLLSKYAPGPEILAYLERTADKFGVNQYVKLSHAVEHAKWNDDEGLWHIRVRNLKEGTVVEDTANVVLSGVGGLSPCHASPACIHR